MPTILGAIVLCSALSCLSGCGNRFSTDARIDSALREAELNAHLSLQPSKVSDKNETTTESMSNSKPDTTNPPAEAISFAPAAEDRDVNARLESYARDEGLVAGAGTDSNTKVIALEDALKIAQSQGREYQTAEEEYILAAIALLIERHQWGPRFFNDLTAGISGNADDGRFEHATSIINTLRATKRLPYGGSVEAKAVVAATDQLREQVTGGYEQSSRLALSAKIPLLRGAGEIAREDLIQAERDLIYKARDFERFRRELLVSVCDDYFRLLQSRSEITNQENQLRSLERLTLSTQERVSAGRREAFEADLARNRVLQAQADLASLRERYILQLDRFKVRLGLNVDERITISDRIFDLPEPDITPLDAANRALTYRLDLQNDRDGVDDARRGLRNARNGLLPDFNLAGEIAVPTDDADSTGGLSIDADETEYELAATLSLPLDREAERLELRKRIIAVNAKVREYERKRDDVIISVRAALRNIEQARFRLQLAEQQVVINTRRLEGQRLKSDEVDPQDVVDAENDKLDAENQRDAARTQLRNAVLNYLLESDQLRVDREGQLLMPSGVRVSP